MHDRAGRGCPHGVGEARRIGDVHLCRQRSLPELVNQDGAREALRPGDEYRPQARGAPCVLSSRRSSSIATRWVSAVFCSESFEMTVE